MRDGETAPMERGAAGVSAGAFKQRSGMEKPVQPAGSNGFPSL
jgi:hypothetical protein